MRPFKMPCGERKAGKDIIQFMPSQYAPGRKPEVETDEREMTRHSSQLSKLEIQLTSTYH